MSEREDSHEYCMIEVDRDNNCSMTIMDAQYIIGVTNGKPHAFFFTIIRRKIRLRSTLISQSHIWDTYSLFLGPIWSIMILNL